MMWPRLVNDPKDKPLEARNYRQLSMRGRLKPGVTVAQAQAEIAAIGKNLERAYPDTNHNQNAVVRTELQARIQQSPPDAQLVAMLITLAIAVLLVACANVAGLLTSRAPTRAREIALRLAIGAGRQRLIRQLLTESLLIAIAGGLLGLLVGYGGVLRRRARTWSARCDPPPPMLPARVVCGGGIFWWPRRWRLRWCCSPLPHSCIGAFSGRSAGARGSAPITY